MVTVFGLSKAASFLPHLFCTQSCFTTMFDVLLVVTAADDATETYGTRAGPVFVGVPVCLSVCVCACCT